MASAVCLADRSAFRRCTRTLPGFSSLLQGAFRATASLVLPLADEPRNHRECSQPELSLAQCKEDDLKAWCTEYVGLRDDVADEYAATLARCGLDSARAVGETAVDDLRLLRIRTGHARLMSVQAAHLMPRSTSPGPAVAPAPTVGLAPAVAGDGSNESMVEVPISEARDRTAAALRAIGWDRTDAALQAEIMTAAELCGNNQGLVKMYQPQLMAPASGAAKPTVERETSSSAVINANQSPGMLAAVMAADLAAKKALTAGPIAIVGAYNTSTSSGQLAFYAERMAKKGLVAVCLANSPEFVAAAAGGKAVYGTNPIAFGFPRPGGEPLKFDMATSAIALFGVLTAKAKGQSLPEGVAYGKNGQPCTDAAEVLDGGAIATFGGHKGAGLALSVELLAGVLSGGAVLGECDSKKAAKSWGHTMIAIKPDALVDDFGRKVESVLAAVKASGPQIRLPGEASGRVAAERRKSGKLPIAAKIWESICKTASGAK